MEPRAVREIAHLADEPHVSHDDDRDLDASDDSTPKNPDGEPTFELDIGEIPTLPFATEGSPGGTPEPGAPVPTESVTVTVAEGQVLADRYEVRRELGAGGMGAVFEVFDRLHERAKAIKILRPDLMSRDSLRTRFLHESKISQELQHPNIINVFDVHRDGDLYFITMELLEGVTLREHLARRFENGETFTVDEVMEVARPVCEALHYAHGRGLIHRDIKPENLFVTTDGEIKVMDFGIAHDQERNLTVTGQVLGSLRYMPLEQLKGKGSVDPRADQYTTSLVLYEMLTGELPEDTLKPAAEVRSDVSETTSIALERGYGDTPDERFPDMLAFLDELDPGGAVRAVDASGAAAVVGGTEPPRTNPWPWLALAGAGAAAALVWLGPWGGDDATGDTPVSGHDVDLASNTEPDGVPGSSGPLGMMKPSEPIDGPGTAGGTGPAGETPVDDDAGGSEGSEVPEGPGGASGASATSEPPAPTGGRNAGSDDPTDGSVDEDPVEPGSGDDDVETPAVDDGEDNGEDGGSTNTAPPPTEPKTLPATGPSPADLANMQDDDGYTNLMRFAAARDCKLDEVEAELAKGARLDHAEGQKGYTAIHLAVLADCPDVVQRLLDVDPSASLLATSSDRNALHSAVTERNVAIARVLLERAPEREKLLQARDNRYGRAPLHYAAQLGPLDMIELLIENGARLDPEDGGGNTPLHVLATARTRGDLEDCARLLLEHAPELMRATNRDLQTPLMLAKDSILEDFFREWLKEN